QEPSLKSYFRWQQWHPFRYTPALHLNIFSCIASFSSCGPKVCIVGSGPAGFYTAQHLIKVWSAVHNPECILHCLLLLPAGSNKKVMQINICAEVLSHP
uniref:FAD/NAD(P)-binding domain-containing protein n=1 Tax=Amphilophus citrinellus TaxID=61819 RepID=A0A3Q0SSJ7_AMPCI